MVDGSKRSLSEVCSVTIMLLVCIHKLGALYVAPRYTERQQSPVELVHIFPVQLETSVSPSSEIAEVPKCTCSDFTTFHSGTIGFPMHGAFLCMGISWEITFNFSHRNGPYIRQLPSYTGHSESYVFSYVVNRINVWIHGAFLMIGVRG